MCFASLNCGFAELLDNEDQARGWRAAEIGHVEEMIVDLCVEIEIYQSRNTG